MNGISYGNGRARTQVCELCGRAVARLTKHHLIPQARHRNRRNKKNFTREEVKQRILWLCGPCHRQTQALLSEKELEYQYNTREALLSHAEVRKFVNWMRNKPEHTVVPVRRRGR